MELGWKSPVHGPVHPNFVPLNEPSGLGWLDGFDELFVRCGLESNGAPDFDDTFSGAVGLGFDWDSDLGMIGGEIEFGGLGADTYNSVGGTVTYTLQF